ncbi:hypothetical protein [Dialister sp.]|nr:hypothetical protein [Dialister sp.]
MISRLQPGDEIAPSTGAWTEMAEIRKILNGIVGEYFGIGGVEGK